MSNTGPENAMQSENTQPENVQQNEQQAGKQAEQPANVNQAPTTVGAGELSETAKFLQKQAEEAEEKIEGATEAFGMANPETAPLPDADAQAATTEATAPAEGTTPAITGEANPADTAAEVQEDAAKAEAVQTAATDSIGMAGAGGAADELAEEDDTEEDDQHEEHEEEDEEEQVDYEGLDFDQLLVHARTLLSHKSPRSAASRAADMHHVVKSRVQAAEQEARQQYQAAKDAGEEKDAEEQGFSYDIDPKAKEIFTILKEVKVRKKQFFESERKEREQNLATKQNVMDQLKAIIEDTDQKGGFNKVQELQKQWKATGPVPMVNAEDINKSYIALLDRFYDMKSIESELKDLDRKKNLASKLEICERAEALNAHANLSEAVANLNKLHEEFKALGPVPKEQQEEVWQRFKTASDAVYDKKRAASEEFKKQLKQNMQDKQELCLLVEPFATFESDRIKEWNSKTKELLELQKKWDSIGSLPREVAKDINKQFWGNFKKFFQAKNKFFEKLDKERKENLEKKQELVKLAQELQESTDWNAASNKLRQAQEDWRNIGPVPNNQRENIYKQFKTACDAFFERRRNRGSIEAQQQQENLKQKDAVLDKLDAAAKGEEAYSDEVLDTLMKEYFAIGFVPNKNISSAAKKLSDAVDNYLAKLPKDKEGDKKRKEIKAELAKKVPAINEAKRKKEMGSKNEIQKLRNDIALWENNLEFFANSTTATKLREEFQKKIDKANQKLAELEGKVKSES